MTYLGAISPGSMRGFGAIQSEFAVETIVDELAVKIGVDPIELRKTSVLSEDEAVGTGARLRSMRGRRWGRSQTEVVVRLE